MYYVDFQGTFVGVLDKKKDQIIGLWMKIILTLLKRNELYSLLSENSCCVVVYGLYKRVE